MALSPEEKSRLLMILTLLSQGQQGRATLSQIQPIIAMIEKQKAEEQARKDRQREQNNAIAAQVGGTVGAVGTAALINQATAPTVGAVGTSGATAGTATAGGATAGGTAAGGATAGGTAASGTAAGGATGAGTGTAGAGGSTAAGSAGGGGVASVVLPAAAAAITANNAWEGGLKDIARGRGDSADYVNTALNWMPWGRWANVGLRLLGKRSVGHMVTSGKSDSQLLRDDFRGLLKDKGVVDGQYNVTLADGSKFNLGLDGKTKYQNVGENIDGRTERNAWDVDHSNPLATFAAREIDPQIRNIFGKDKGIHPEQYTGMLVNAVTSNAKTEDEVRANIKAILANTPLLPSSLTAPPPPSTRRGMLDPNLQARRGQNAAR